jgi:hypothetical protein
LLDTPVVRTGIRKERLDALYLLLTVHMTRF